MNKRIIVINGKGGSGKDTLVKAVGELVDILNVSSVDPVKQAAKLLGWKGEKDDRARKFLSSIKDAVVEYNDLANRYCLQESMKFLYDSDYRNTMFMFVHIREESEILKFKNNCEVEAITLLVTGRDDGTRSPKDSDEVFNHMFYDYVFENSGDIEDARKRFVEMILTF